MNILVPTDFSEIASSAIRYAAMIAKKMDANIILFHAVPHLSLWTGLDNSELVETAHKKQETIKEELVKEGIDADKIQAHVFYRFPLNIWIEDFIQKNKIDFAVIGTKGSTGLKNVMIGSFALGMIEHASIPVIAVPPDATLKDIRTILYPTDLQETLKELQIILPYAQMFDATIHLIYVSKNELPEKLKSFDKLKGIAEGINYKKITTDVKTGGNIESLIEESIRETNADLLIMFPKERGFFNQLFKGSVTEEVSHLIRIPLFAIKKK